MPIFFMTFCLLLAGLVQSLYAIKKVICSILNIHLFDVFDLYVFSEIAFNETASNKLLFEY